jgi:hypothetical protein
LGIGPARETQPISDTDFSRYSRNEAELAALPPSSIHPRTHPIRVSRCLSRVQKWSSLVGVGTNLLPTIPTHSLPPLFSSPSPSSFPYPHPHPGEQSIRCTARGCTKHHVVNVGVAELELGCRYCPYCSYKCGILYSIPHSAVSVQVALLALSASPVRL